MSERVKAYSRTADEVERLQEQLVALYDAMTPAERAEVNGGTCLACEGTGGEFLPDGSVIWLRCPQCNGTGNDPNKNRIGPAVPSSPDPVASPADDNKTK